jgi:hypothetical protein
MTNTAIFLSGLVMLMASGAFTVSTFDTHNWMSLIFGVLLGILGVMLSFYGMGVLGATETA